MVDGAGDTAGAEVADVVEATCDWAACAPHALSTSAVIAMTADAARVVPGPLTAKF